MKKIAVYGTLREGFGNHRIIQDQDLLSKEVVTIPFRMISLGGFPGLVPSDTMNEITIEVYSVDDSSYRSVEILEGYPSFYQKAIIPTSHGDAEAYVLLHERYQSSSRNVVEGGDWVEFIKKTVTYSY